MVTHLEVEKCTAETQRSQRKKHEEGVFIQRQVNPIPLGKRFFGVFYSLKFLSQRSLRLCGEFFLFRAVWAKDLCSGFEAGGSRYKNRKHRLAIKPASNLRPPKAILLTEERQRLSIRLKPHLRL